MNICLICDEYPPSRHGGIGSFVRMFARELTHKGHGTRVIGIYPENDSNPVFENDDGVQVWRIRPPLHRGGWIAARYRLFRQIAKWAGNGEIDLVEVPDYRGPAAAWPRLPVPVIARLHGSSTYFASEMGWRVSRTTRIWEQMSLLRADFCCSTSRYTAEKTTRLLSGRLTVDSVLHNFTQQSTCQEAGDRSRWRVTYTGTLTPKKGVVALIDAWPSVQACFPKAELHLYGGDGRMENGQPVSSYLAAKLGRWINDTVVYHGFLPRDEVLQLLRTSRCAVFPSFSEAFALAPIEAMALGCPTIYTRLASGPELIDDGRTGLLVDPRRPPDIAEAIIRILGNDALALRLGSQGRQYVNNNLSAEVMTARNEQFYRSCLELFDRRSAGSPDRRFSKCPQRL